VLEYNLVIPMAGLGSRFTQAGYKTPKPLLPIGKYRMFEVVIANFASNGLKEISIVAPESFELEDVCVVIAKKLGIKVHLTELKEVTDGPATTVGIGLKCFENSLPVVVANSDQFLDFKIEAWLSSASAEKHPGSILVMEDDDPKWSYVSLNAEGLVEEVREKEVISNFATCGVYYFADAGDLSALIDFQRQVGNTVNGEFYVAPIFDIMAKRGDAVGVFNLGPVASVMFGLGVPSDYESFLASAAKEKAEAVATAILS